MTQPLLFDRPLGFLRYHRALKQGFANFLLEHAIEDMGERLGVITRQFSSGADIGTVRDDACRYLKAMNRVGSITRLSPIDDGSSLNAGVLEGHEEVIPFPAEQFDLVISLLALQGANDLPGVLVQIRRLLIPDGLFLGCMFGGSTLTELRQVMMQAESEIEGGVSPRVAPFADIKDVGSLMQRAGFALPVVDSEPLCVRYNTLFDLIRDLRAMGLTNVLTERSKRPLKRQTFMRAAELYAQDFSDPDGRIRATFDVVWMLGWAPHESQQKPLRPGTAKMNLADALRITNEPHQN